MVVRNFRLDLLIEKRKRKVFRKLDHLGTFLFRLNTNKLEYSVNSSYNLTNIYYVYFQDIFKHNEQLH